MIDINHHQLLEGLNFEAVDRAAALPPGESFYNVVMSILTGELDLGLGGVLGRLGSSLFSEIGILTSLLREMVIIALLSAILSAISLNLRSKAVADLGFYAVYMIIVALLLDSFLETVTIMRGFAGTLGNLVEASVPLMVSLLLVSGNPSSAAVFNPLAMFAAGAVQFIIRDVAAPVLIFAAVLEIINNLSQREMLSRLAKLIRTVVKTGLGALAGLFAGVLTLHRIGAPIVDGAAVRAARLAVNAVPVVGQALSGAVDTAALWSGAVKNSVLTAVIVVIILLCLPVIVKLLAFVIAYKLTAALIEPICDKRVSAAINAAGDLAALALGACALAAAAFVFMAMVMISL